MSRVMVWYSVPEDPKAFEIEYRGSHLPLVQRVPGLRSVEVSRVQTTLVGDPAPFLVAVLDFDDEDALRAGMASPEWAASGRNLKAIGGLALATMVILGSPERLLPVAGEPSG